MTIACDRRFAVRVVQRRDDSQSGCRNVAIGKTSACGHEVWRIQLVNATVWLTISAGVWKPRVVLGLSFNCLAKALSLACG